ncbi:uncharacterized protein LOC6588389 isoform X2 [Drosophila persimilis]|uniref:uncharacterized protein LOC6588389 isoform X2 n=1 Tax=Drosophila persimilis TaxID=7234 RepID=UPI000F090A08|nr:uncharacterized protein LOC6588389 isoform X2 [Drosophila persimilis]
MLACPRICHIRLIIISLDVDVVASLVEPLVLAPMDVEHLVLEAPMDVEPVDAGPLRPSSVPWGAKLHKSLPQELPRSCRRSCPRSRSRCPTDCTCAICPIHNI